MCSHHHITLLSKSVYEISELEQIELLNSQTEGKLIALLDQMPVGVVQFDPETDKIEWFNPLQN